MVRRRIVGFEPPLKQAAKFEMVVNVKTAKAIGSSCRCHFSCAPTRFNGMGRGGALCHRPAPALWRARSSVVRADRSLRSGWKFELAPKGPELVGLPSVLWSLRRLIPAWRRFRRVVSGLEIRLPGNGDRCQAETRFE